MATAPQVPGTVRSAPAFAGALLNTGTAGLLLGGAVRAHPLVTSTAPRTTSAARIAPR
ncbi:hypothetical protein [Actinophytocola glycyrrhizae]|uniref:Uncharacterized protein n=1 Tax=Actinophytocola glycyrrhizae TaxID=2044873 RepID=A0ABV9SEV3_9PSEU